MTMNICEAFGSITVQDKLVSKQQLTIVITKSYNKECLTSLKHVQSRSRCLASFKTVNCLSERGHETKYNYVMVM